MKLLLSEIERCFCSISVCCDLYNFMICFMVYTSSQRCVILFLMIIKCYVLYTDSRFWYCDWFRGSGK